ncbi:MAG TPA: hypothetical protein VFB27_15460 [Opitutaceae bacterium]|nr:hypothetical protein [Opitutaceae bacterium]
MTPIEHLNRLDELIVEHTKAPIAVTLRNQLSIAREQVEALQAEHLALKNAYVVLKNQSQDAIVRLEEENKKLIKENHKIVAENTEASNGSVFKDDHLFNTEKPIDTITD